VKEGLIMNNKIFKLVGVTFDSAQENIKMFGCRDIGSFALVREPDNEHDTNAIRVQVAGRYLGYIPRQVAKDLAPELDAGEDYLAFFVKRNESPYEKTVGLTVRILKHPYQIAA
jgi:hypothetical protein